MAGHVKKSTKKFEKKQLKGELERRRALKKVKQRRQVIEKKRARRSKENVTEETATGSSADHAPEKAALQDMTVDEFFQGGFEIPTLTSKSKSKKRKRSTLDERSTDHGQKNSVSTAPDDAEVDDASDASDESSVVGHKQDLDALAENDPEFYRHLQENDPELLDFDVPLSENGEEESDSGAHGTEDAEEANVRGAKHVTSKLVRQWKEAMVANHSVKAFKELTFAFRAAVHTEEDSEKEYKYAVSSAEVFHEIMVVALAQVPEVLQHHLPVKETSTGKTKIPTESKKYKTLSNLVNAHVTSIIQLLGTLSDTSTLKATLSSLNPLLPYIIDLKKPLKNLLKIIVGIWSDPANDEVVRITAFLVLRRTAAIANDTVREAVLKASYQGLVRGSRQTTAHTLPAINLMKNAAVELWGLEGDLGYTTGFHYIRQLAIHLRTSITQPSKESHKAIYNWQYIHSLDFWSRVLATHCSPFSNAAIRKSSDSPLHPLIYPLVQITLGALRLICSPTYFPLRFHLIQSLLRISRATQTYIPLAPALIEVLQSPELRTVPRPTTLRPLDFNVTLRAPKSYLRTRVFQDGVGEQVIFLLGEFFGVWAKNIAFPELIVPPTAFLRRWLKEVSPGGKKGGASGAKMRGNANQKLNNAMSLLLQKLTANASYVEAQRSKVEFAVSNREGVEMFLRDMPWEDLPLGAFVVTLRRQREERERLLEQSREEQRRRDMETRDVGEGGAAESQDESESDEEEDVAEDEDVDMSE